MCVCSMSARQIFGSVALPPVRSGKSFRTGQAYEDGMLILYVNAAVDDGSARARLMQYFRTVDPEDRSQGGTVCPGSVFENRRGRL